MSNVRRYVYRAPLCLENVDYALGSYCSSQGRLVKTGGTDYDDFQEGMLCRLARPNSFQKELFRIEKALFEKNLNEQVVLLTSD